MTWNQSLKKKKKRFFKCWVNSNFIGTLKTFVVPENNN